MSDQVEEVKSKTDIVAVISGYIQLKKAGRNLKANCPFHGEKTPSFMVNPELQIFKCFGCGVGGDAFTFLQKMEGMEFGEALKTLAERAGIKLVSYKPTDGEETRERLIGINELAAEYYHYLLTKHELGQKALDYLKGRGISLESIDRFRLGFAPEGWSYLMKFLTQKKNFKPEELERVGLTTRGYDRFRNRIMFPLRNHRGQVMGFAGRILDKSDQAKYVNTSETELYHKSELLYGLDVARSEIKQAGYAVIVEGEIDMIASWQAGVKNVAAIKGSAVTEKHVELLRRYCDTLVIALDADLAGDGAARRGINIALKAGMIVKMVRMKGAKDPGEMAIQEPETWKRLVAEAIPIYDFYIESAVERFGLEVVGKKRIGQEVLPIIAEIEDEIEKAHYLRQLAKLLEVAESDVRNQLAKIPNPKSSLDFARDKQIPKNDPMTKRSRREVVEEYVVEVALKLEKVDELVKVPFIRGNFWMKIIEELKKDKQIKNLPAELRGRVEELILVEDEPDDKEWQKAIAQLEEVDIREKIQGSRVWSTGDKAQEVADLIKRLGELTRDK